MRTAEAHEEAKTRVLPANMHGPRGAQPMPSEEGGAEDDGQDAFEDGIYKGTDEPDADDYIHT